MLNFEYTNATKIIFGRKTENEVGKQTKSYGTKVLLHYGSKSIKKYGLYDKVITSLNEAGVDYVELGGVIANPKVSLVREGIQICKNEGIDFILAVGGGSVIDSAKAIAAGFYYEGDVWDLFTKGAMTEKALPVGCILTLAASGTESSIATIITNYEEGLKRGFRHEMVRPVFAILNPELTFTLPKHQTACGAVDIIGHVIERYFTNTESVELTDRFCESIMTTVLNNAHIVYKNSNHYNARAEIMLAGMHAHNGMASTGREEDWASHNMEYEITTQSGIAHAAGLSILYPAWMTYVYKHDIDRFVLFAEKVFNIPVNRTNLTETALKGIEALKNFYISLDMPTTLTEVGIKDSQIEVMADLVSHFGKRTIGNFVKLDRQDIINIYKLAL